jgi:hypothetical protein
MGKFTGKIAANVFGGERENQMSGMFLSLVRFSI